MAEQNPSPKPLLPAERMMREVASKQRGAQRARNKWNWSSIAVLGVIGWSVTVPTLVGTALGLWIDRQWPTRFSWSVTLLVIGLVFGCVTAWLRVKGDES